MTEPLPTLGGALRDEEEPAAAAEAATVRGRAAPEAGASLCDTCLHAPVCAVASAINVLGATGQIVISKCEAFATLGTEAPAATE